MPHIVSDPSSAVIPSAFSDRSEVTLEISNSKEVGRLTKMWNVNSTRLEQLPGQIVHRKETETYLETDKNENATYQHLMGCSKSSAEREADPFPFSRGFYPQGAGPAGRLASALR